MTTARWRFPVFIVFSSLPLAPSAAHAVTHYVEVTHKYEHHGSGGGGGCMASILRLMGGYLFPTKAGAGLRSNVGFAGLTAAERTKEAHMLPDKMVVLQAAGIRERKRVATLFYEAQFFSQGIEARAVDLGTLNCVRFYAGAEIGPDKAWLFNPYLQLGIGLGFMTWNASQAVSEIDTPGDFAAGLVFKASIGVDIFLSKTFALNVSAGYYPYTDTFEDGGDAWKGKPPYKISLSASPVVAYGGLVWYVGAGS